MFGPPSRSLGKTCHETRGDIACMGRAGKPFRKLIISRLPDPLDPWGLLGICASPLDAG
jgi:hypothetical protein